jgi:hypothetical protein
VKTHIRAADVMSELEVTCSFALWREHERVIPANAGIQFQLQILWIPACAGMTN